MTPTTPAGAQPSPEAKPSKMHIVHPDHGMMEDVADIIGRNGWDGLAATVRAADEAGIRSLDLMSSTYALSESRAKMESELLRRR